MQSSSGTIDRTRRPEVEEALHALSEMHERVFAEVHTGQLQGETLEQLDDAFDVYVKVSTEKHRAK